MSEAAVATKPAHTAPSPRWTGRAGRWGPSGLRAAAWVGLILAAGGFAGVRYWSWALAHTHLHAPRWALLVHAKPLIQLHLAGAVGALGIGTALLLGVKGSRLHRTLGWTWVAAMLTVAVSSLFITETHPGRWGVLHFFSGWTLISLPMGLAAVKRRDIRLHRRMMTGLFVGGLALNSFIAFLPGRLLWRVVAG